MVTLQPRFDGIYTSLRKVAGNYQVKGIAAKVPKELPRFVITTTSRICVILFFQNPFREEGSSEGFSKSRTPGFPMRASTGPQTQSAAIMGIRDVKGGAVRARPKIRAPDKHRHVVFEAMPLLRIPVKQRGSYHLCLTPALLLPIIRRTKD